MSGYAYGQHEPTERCPYCGTVCRADFVDIGVGMQQCGPYHCDNCLASEIGPYDKERPLTKQETNCGWYAPGAEPGSSANVIGGKVVGYVEALREYRDEFTGNMMWHDKNYVENWWQRLRGQSPP